MYTYMEVRCTRIWEVRCTRIWKVRCLWKVVHVYGEVMGDVHVYGR